jgi:hypothetical protein
MSQLLIISIENVVLPLLTAGALSVKRVFDSCSERFIRPGADTINKLTGSGIRRTTRKYFF